VSPQTSDELSVPGATAPVVIEADVVVCGAGSAGLGAALAAAREGASVALVERWPFFGGNATAASLGSICGLYVRSPDGSFVHASNGIAREWAEGLSSGGWGVGPIPYKETAVMPYVPWGYKRLADRLVSAEASITPLLHSFISGVVMSGRAIEAIVIATKKGPLAVRGRVFIDATGDADIVFHAGAAWEMGEPGRLQYPSMQFYLQSGDLAAAMGAMGGLADRINEAYKARSYELTRSAGAVIPTMRQGEFVGAMTRIAKPDGSPPDGTDVFDLTEAEMRGRTIAEEAARFLIEQIPGFSSSFLADTATTVGIRETRHAVGDHVVSFDEAAACTKYPDGIAAATWPFEFHTEGAETRWEFLPDGDWFEIPYRSLLVSGVDNLLVAGRCVSMTHEALASARVTGTCMAIGEGAGTAAAKAAAGGVALRDVDGEKLRAELVDRGSLPSSR
jgi:hypothetical protein